MTNKEKEFMTHCSSRRTSLILETKKFFSRPARRGRRDEFLAIENEGMGDLILNSFYSLRSLDAPCKIVSKISDVRLKHLSIQPAIIRKE